MWFTNFVFPVSVIALLYWKCLNLQDEIDRLRKINEKK